MATDLAAGVLFLAPGFLALKLFYLFGAQRVRSQWEWTTWSVIASLPIGGLASVLRDGAGGPRTDTDPLEISLRLLVGIALGGLAALAWQMVRRSRTKRAARLRTWFGSSAWDEALEDVTREKRQVELVLEDDTRYAGTIRYGGREDNEAEGWIYLVHPEVLKIVEDGLPDAGRKKFRPARGTEGCLVHRDRIKRIRVLKKPGEPDVTL